MSTVFSRLPARAPRPSAAVTAAILAFLAMTAGLPVAAKAAQPSLLSVEIASPVQDGALAEEVAFLLREGLLDVEGLSVLPRGTAAGPALPSISVRLSRDGAFSAVLSAGEGAPPFPPLNGRFDGTSPFDGADRIYGSLLPGLREALPTASWPPSLSYPTLSTEALRLYIKGLAATDEADRLVLLTQSAAADISFSAPLVERGRVFLAAGAVDAAMEDFRLALESRPGHREAHTGLGKAYRRRGDTGVAESHFREALRTDPLYGEAKNSLDEMLGRRGPKSAGKTAPAEEKDLPAPSAAVDGEKGGKNTPSSRHDRETGSAGSKAPTGRTRQQLEDIELEMELFLSVGMEKEAADARRRRDELLEKPGRLQQNGGSASGEGPPAADEEVARPAGADPGRSGPSPEERLADDYRRRGENAMRRGETEKAAELFESYLSVGGGDPDVIYSLAELCLGLKKYARSRELFSAAARAYDEIRKSKEK